MKKGTQLLEIYALEIQMYTAQKNNKKLKALYEQSLHIKSAIPHPLIMGVIRGNNCYLLAFSSMSLHPPIIVNSLTCHFMGASLTCHFMVASLTCHSMSHTMVKSLTCHFMSLFMVNTLTCHFMVASLTCHSMSPITH